MSECRIRIRNGSREIELAGDRLFVEEQLARYAAWVQASDEPAQERRGEPSPPTADASLDPEALRRVSESFRVRSTLPFLDFVRLKAPKSPLGRLLVLAYFLEKYRQRTAYPPEELQGWWVEHWPSETLDAQLWEEAVSAGFLEWETPEALTLTYRGQLHVRDGLA